MEKTNLTPPPSSPSSSSPADDAAGVSPSPSRPSPSLSSSSSPRSEESGVFIEKEDVIEAQQQQQQGKDKDSNNDDDDNDSDDIVQVVTAHNTHSTDKYDDAEEEEKDITSSDDDNDNQVVTTINDNNDDNNITTTTTTTVDNNDNNPTLSSSSSSHSVSKSISQLKHSTTKTTTTDRPPPINTTKKCILLHPFTPIPNSDSALRLLRKFIHKTMKFFPTSMGGTKVQSFLSYFFSTATTSGDDKWVSTNQCCIVYKQLMDILLDDDDEEEENDDDDYVDDDKYRNKNDINDNEVVIESILGHTGDTMSKARKAMGAFCHLIETWCLETQRLRIIESNDTTTTGSTNDNNNDEYVLDNNNNNIDDDDRNGDNNGQSDNHGMMKEYIHILKKSYFYQLRHPIDHTLHNDLYSTSTILSSELMSIAFTCAEALVAHGCLDGVMIGIGDAEQHNVTFGSSGRGGIHMPSISEEDLDTTLDDNNEEEKDEGREDNIGNGRGGGDESFQLSSSSFIYEEPTYVNAVTILADSIFISYLDSEEVELAGLKFLLTTGCRTNQQADGYDEAMLRGGRLLQTIRVCYRIYLSTRSEANKTTAKAALRQIVISAFKRLENTTHLNPAAGTTTAVEFVKGNDDPFSPTALDENNDSIKQLSSNDDRSTAAMSYGANFSTFEHKDAYLVLRSLCKLSMKASVGGAFQNVVIVRNESMRSAENTKVNLPPKQEMMMDPSLDSKILALDLLVEILQCTKTEILQNAGPQLIYAVRNYLCHSLLKNCTSDNNYVVSLSLRLFVPLIRHFRSHLKTEIEAFVTNVFFVILDSKNSTIEHKLRVVILFEEICSDPATLAEIFLNYDCDLSAVDLFQRIVNTLAKVAKIGLHGQAMNSGGIFVAGAGVARAEKSRQDHRELRLEAMKAVKQVLSSLHESFVSTSVNRHQEKVNEQKVISSEEKLEENSEPSSEKIIHEESNPDSAAGTERQSLVQIYDSKKKRREEAAKATLKFNQKPTAGIKFASEVGLINGDDPADVAQFLLTNKDVLDKTQIGEYLGREPDYQNGFPLKVLHQYLNLLDFTGLLFDDAIKFYLSGFRLPGEAQKIDRIMEKFAERYTSQNPDIFPTADAAFILAFSIIMLNTDLHNPAIKEERRMTKHGFLRNNSGICDGKDLPEEYLSAIFDRIKSDPISLKEDDELREKAGTSKARGGTNASNSGIFTSNFSEMDRKRESDYQKERDQILRNTESLLRRKKKRGTGRSGSSKAIGNFVRTYDSGLKDEYVNPMFDVTWGPALAVFSTVIESANGTMGTLLSIATDKEIESAAENAAAATEVCLGGFRLAIRIAALCGNDTARSAYVHALSNFSLLGTGRLLEHRHIRCVQTLLEIGRDDGELLGSSWEYIFKALSEVARLNQVYEATARATRVEAEARERKLRRKMMLLEAKRERELATEDDGADIEANNNYADESDFMDSFDDDEFELEEEMDKKAIDETNARMINDSIPADISDMIYVRSGSMSVPALKDFIFQLCRVSRMEIAGYGGHVASKANDVDLTAVHYRKHHTLLTNVGDDTTGRRNQPDIHSLQKLVEVTHYNMDSRPRLIFAEIWSIISSHLTSTSLHENAAVAIYAVDSFRQLSIQFLQREELGVFEFQRKFLKPFEVVMSKCNNASVKEFLLKAIEQIILMFESDEGVSSSAGEHVTKRSISIRSGWRPILSVMGIASSDDDDGIANLGFAMLTTQLRQTLQLRKTADKETVFSSGTVIRADKFVDLVDALLMYTSGPREDKSSLSIDHLVTMARYLADESIPLPKRCMTTFSNTAKNDVKDINEPTKSSSLSTSEELELWWPLLLGLSKTVGDVRPNIRIKGLVTLLGIINQHFFPSTMKEKHSSVLGDIETLQLIFKGILTPALEHAETNVAITNNRISLPDGFIRFMTRGAPLPEVGGKGGRKNRTEENDVAKGNNWIDTTFDHLMDGSIALALKSLEIYKDDMLIEEVLAMFNTCLDSDSSVLVIRGMKRLHHFIISDLSLEIVTENTWATVCHMLHRCLSVRGLPFDYRLNGTVKEGDNQIIQEFLQEEELFSSRRYIGSNAALMIGTILCDKQVVDRMGLKWYIFLLSGLNAGIKAWDTAGAIFDSHPPKSNPNEASPPHYAESALYARKWMMRLLLPKLTSGEIAFVPQLKGILKDEFEALVEVYLRKEAQEGSSPGLVLEMEHMAKMICELLEAISVMDDSQLAEISSLTPTLSECIQINDKVIRKAVHGLLQKIFQSNLLGGSLQKKNADL